ncbi:MAG TPA: TetR/AcrR family transcriptional regulator [Thermomicrobiales bacterium]|jgi:AcrR family transcriptional regulator|nr:TetR/AcrR family transcriptional regulator [Thermomicrobiales bacterium]
MIADHARTGGTNSGRAGVTRADARRNRARLLAAAEALFAAEGSGVSIDEIARRAGVGIGTVYRHFPTKEILFAAVVRERLERLAADARHLLAADDPGQAFFAFFRSLVEAGATKKDLADALSGAGVDIASQTADLATELREALAELLTRAQRAGAVRHDIDAADLDALLAGVLLALDHRRGDTALRERMIAVVIDGLQRGSS